MEQVIREVTGDEAKLLALQFLGQNMGEMKELDKHIVSSLKPIAGSINPNSMLQSIPQGSVQQPPVQQPVAQPVAPVATAPIAPANGPIVIPSLASLQSPASTTIAAPAQVDTDPNQLELNFNSSPYSEQIFNKLDALERKITTIIETQQELVDFVNTFKKKSRASATASL